MSGMIRIGQTVEWTDDDGVERRGRITRFVDGTEQVVIVKDEDGITHRPTIEQILTPIITRMFRGGGK